MIWNAFAIAVREIGRNLTRAFLTVLGIFIGVAAIITMVTLGEGATLAVKAQISSLGSNLLTLRPGAGFGSRAVGVPNFTEKDAEIIGEQIAGIAALAPVRSASSATLTSESGHVEISGSRTLCEATREMSRRRSSRRPERTPLIVASLRDTTPKSKSGTRA